MSFVTVEIFVDGKPAAIIDWPVTLAFPTVSTRVDVCGKACVVRDHARPVIEIMKDGSTRLFFTWILGST